ncbi:site-specific integrase [Pyxidicoccus xibeiensis]|uniref:site-specific integrase n=1 Tax=Pyxidicoccus xibeiensis TaxID=2906759 RepID=UPI0020A77CF9|nr:site-specific integrase [Pyxidicoccus xibeiensis]MCP3137535.1 site-specific integrase [Pyxidicoccus xibeiensis]
MSEAAPPEYPSQQRQRAWPGGFVRLSRGREVFVIERRAGSGKRYKIALDVRTEREALAELALFERDPAGYQTRKQQRRERAADTGGMRLDAAALGEFFTDARAKVARGELSVGYVRHALQPYLIAWAEALGGRELRAVSLAELNAILGRWTGAGPKRIVVLKAFTAWARSKGRLAQKDDPTLGLKVPPVTTRPMEARAFTASKVEAVYAALRNYTFAPGHGSDAPASAPRVTVDMQPVRDVFVLRAKCGMHGTEIDRLARGAGTVRVLTGQGEIAATLVFPHKRGGEHVVSVDAQALAAAQRLQARGKAPDPVTTSRAVARVIAEYPELDGFAFERLRHTFITLGAAGRVVTAKGGGVPLELLSQVAGHTSTATTRRHYLGTHVPPMVVLPLQLVNEDDPKPAPTAP